MPIGDITGVVDTLQDTIKGLQPSLVYRGFNIGVVATRSDDGYGVVKTFAVSDFGILGDNFIDSLQFDAVACNEPRLYQIAGSLFAVVYAGTANHLTIKTFTITSLGLFDSGIIDTETFLDIVGTDPEMCHVFQNVWVVCFCDPSNDTRVVTIVIQGGGEITSTEYPMWVVETSSGSDPIIIKHEDIYYIVAFKGDYGNNRSYSIGIANTGEVDEITHGSVLWDAQGFQDCHLFSDNKNLIICAYQNDYDGKGYVKTSVTSPDCILSEVVDSFTLDNTYCVAPRIFPVGNNVYGVVYQDATNRGILRTLTIYGGGVIENTEIASLVFNATNGAHPSPVHIAGDYYAIAHTMGASPWLNLGITTVKIATPTGGRSDYMMGIL